MDARIDQAALEKARPPCGGFITESLPWAWRNCRSIGFRFCFWLWPWALGFHRDEDIYGGDRWVYAGPFSFGISYSIGNASSRGIDRFTALSEQEAHERALRAAIKEKEQG